MKTDHFFNTAAVQDEDVTLADGSVAKLPFKKIGSAEWTRFQAGMASGDPAMMSTAMLRLIWASLCEADGSQALTMEQVEKLDQAVASSMYQAAFKVNAPQKNPGKT